MVQDHFVVAAIALVCQPMISGPPTQATQARFLGFVTSQHPRGNLQEISCVKLTHPV